LADLYHASKLRRLFCMGLGAWPIAADACFIWLDRDTSHIGSDLGFTCWLAVHRYTVGLARRANCSATPNGSDIRHLFMDASELAFANLSLSGRDKLFHLSPSPIGILRAYSNDLAC